MSQFPDRSEEVKARIEQVGELPTLPVVAMRVAEMVSDPDSNVNKVVSVLANDAALTAKILKVANSAYYSTRKEIETLNMAIVILGMKEVYNLVTAISIFGAFPKDKFGKGFDYYKFWLHCASVAEIGKILASRLRFRDVATIFTAGLIHDIGKILLAQYYPDEFSRAMEIAEKENVAMTEAECRVLGVDHATIGGWLADNWKLPGYLRKVIGYHHKFEELEDYRDEVAFISVANQLCNMVDVRFGSGHSTFEPLTDPAWQYLRQISPALVDVDTEEFIKEMHGEVENAQTFLRFALEL